MAFTCACAALAQAAVPSQNFGNLTVGASTAQDVAVSFAWVSASSTFSLSYSGDFSKGAITCQGVGSCSVHVTFSPQAAGLRQSALLVKDAAGLQTGAVLLYGIGLGSQVSVHPGLMSSVAQGTNFPDPQGIAIDPAGNLYISDDLNESIQEVSAAGVVTTFTGTTGVLVAPGGLALDGAGNIYVADPGANKVWKINIQTGTVGVFAGGGSPTPPGVGDGGAALGAVLSGPSAVASDGAGSIYIADTNHGLIRKVDAAGTIWTVAGGGTMSVAPWGDGASALNAALSSPQGIAVDAGGNVLYIADSGHSVIRYVSLSTGIIGTYAGNGSPGSGGDSGPAVQAALHTPVGLRVDAAGDLFIADSGNDAIREVLAGSGEIITIASDGSPVRDVAVSAAGNLYFAEALNIRKVAFTLQPANFGAVDVGLASGPMAQTVFNTGNQPLSASVTVGGSAFRQDISEPYDCGSSSTVLPGSTGCVISVQFMPSAAGATTGSITLNTSANGSLSAVLSGAGVAAAVPNVVFSPAALIFQPQVAGTVSQPQTVMVTNTGSADLHINALYLTGTNTTAFQPSSNCSTVAATSSCTISVTFTPQALGSYSAELVVGDELASSPQTVAITGTAIPPSIYSSLLIAQNTSIQIGGASAALSLSMQGDGNLVLYQSGALLWSSGTGGQNCGTNQCYATLQPDGNFVVYNGRTPLWNSVTYGYLGAQLVVSTQAPHLKVVATNGSILWAESYSFAAGNFVLAQGASVINGSLSLTMQGDGNLMLYQSGALLWSSGTGGQNCGTNQCYATFQPDGNFVVYNGRTPLWNSVTYGYLGAQLVLSSQEPHLKIVAANGSIPWADSYTFAAGNLVLAQGASVISGSLSLAMQVDGNLVLYQSGAVLWSSGTGGQTCGTNQCYAAFQPDGNFVVYNGRTPLWNSATYGYLGAQLVLSSLASHLKIVAANGSIPWAESYAFAAGNFVLAQGASVINGSLSLAMQVDGNLVLYRNKTPLWWSGTSGQNCGTNSCFATFQADGNFVVYNGSTPLWNSATYGYLGTQLLLSGQSPPLQIVKTNGSILWASSYAFDPGTLWLGEGSSVNLGSLLLVMQTDGNLVLYRNQTAMWSSGTAGQACAGNGCFATLQVDGNLVVYNGSRPIWNSTTSGNLGGQLFLSSQPPYLYISASNQSIVWRAVY